MATLKVPVTSSDHTQGDEHAPIILVEYGDYECPHCGRAHVVLQTVLPALEDQIRFIFRNFPLAEVHPLAQVAAEAVESVAKHGGNDPFWTMHDALFENQDALEVDDLLEHVLAAGVEPALVASDLTSGAMTSRVRKDFRSCVRSGVNGTPTFFVSGRRFSGDWTDPTAFAAALHEAARAGTHTAR